jgi:DNA-binding response OmpR family regulator
VTLKRKKIEDKSSKVLSIKGLNLDLNKHMVTCNGEDIDLTKTEFDLFKISYGKSKYSLNKRANIRQGLGV